MFKLSPEDKRTLEHIECRLSIHRAEIGRLQSKMDSTDDPDDYGSWERKKFALECVVNELLLMVHHIENRWPIDAPYPTPEKRSHA